MNMQLNDLKLLEYINALKSSQGLQAQEPQGVAPGVDLELARKIQDIETPRPFQPMPDIMQRPQARAQEEPLGASPMQAMSQQPIPEAMESTPISQPQVDPNILMRARQMEQSAPLLNERLDEPEPVEELGFAEQEFRKMLGNKPVRGKAGIGSTILGFLAGGAGPEAGKRAKYAKYYREMEDWGAQLEPLKELADAETQRRTNERLIKSNEETARRNRAAELAKITDLEIKQQRVDTERFRSKNPGNKYIEDSSGNVWSVNPVTNEREQLLDSAGSPIKTIHLTPEQQKLMAIEKIEATGDQARKTAGVVGDEQRKTEGVRIAGRIQVNNANQGNILERMRTAQGYRVTNAQLAHVNKLAQMEVGAGFAEGLENLRESNREALADLRARHAMELKKTASGNFTLGVGAGGRGLLPTQQKVARVLRMNDIIGEMPELEKYFELDKQGNVRILPLDEVDDTEGDADEENRTLAYQLLMESEKSADIPLPAAQPAPVARPAAPASANPARATSPAAPPATLGPKTPTARTPVNNFNDVPVPKTRSDGKVRVRRLSDGMGGWAVPNFDSSVYELEP